MAFKDNQRIEQIYFSNLKKTIDVLRRWKEGETDLKTADVLQALIDADSAILMMYKNLGEAYAETVSMIEEEKAGLVSLQAELTDFKGEINAKIDEVNSYLLSLIRTLEDRVTELEGSVSDIQTFLTLNTRVRLIYAETIDEDNLIEGLFNWETDEAITYEELYNLCNTNWIIILMDYTQDPPALAYLDKWEDGGVYFTRIEVTHGYDNVSRTYYVSSIIKHVYTILEDEMRYDRYEEDIHGLEQRVTDLANLTMIYKNLVAIKQPSNYYNIFSIEDMQTPLDCEAICNLVMAGVDLRVKLIEEDTYYHNEDYLTVKALNLTLDGQGEITDGEIGFSVVSYDLHTGDLYCKSLSASYNDQTNFRLDTATF